MISRLKVGFILFVTLLFSLNIVYANLFGLEADAATILYDEDKNHYEVDFKIIGDSSQDWNKVYILREQLVEELYLLGIAPTNIANYENLKDRGRLDRDYKRYSNSLSSFLREYSQMDSDEKLQFEQNHERLQNPDINAYFAKLDQFGSGNWDGLTSSEISRMISSGVYSGDLNTLEQLAASNNELLDQDDVPDRNKIELQQELIIELLISDPKLLAQFYDSEDSQSAFEQALENANSCDGSIWNFYCVLNDKLSERDVFEESYQRQIQEILSNSDSQSVDSLNEEITQVTLTYLEGLTKQTHCQSSVSGADFNSCMFSYLETIDSESFCNDIGQGGEDNSCSTIRSIVRDIVRSQTENRLIQVDSVYFFVEGLLNPDRFGVSAARLFGFEDNYADLPAFIRDDLGATMCIGKINGYLDKDVSSGGGVTRYEVQNTSNDIVITADIRAQRTVVDPENSTALTYSYFIRAPEEFGLTYVVALSYTTSNGTEKITLENLQNVSAGEVASGFDNVKIPIANADSLQRDSFTIGILGVRSGTTSKHISLTYPVILIESGDRYFQEGAISNDQGHIQVTGGGSNDNSLDDEDLLDILFT